MPVPNEQTEAIREFRSRASFNSYTLSCFLFGGHKNVQQRAAAWARVEAIVGANDSWKLPKTYGSQNRSEQFDEGLEVGKAMFEDQLAYDHDFFHDITYNFRLANSGTLSMTTVIFIPCLKYLATEEQAALWIPQALRGEMIGTYAQTELGHGTFVRGLETTATYDAVTEEFVLHSPTVTSTKFWPGGLGLTVTHAVIMAQLWIGGKGYGLHGFFAQLRSLGDGKPLQGLELGDIGLKYSYNQVDNGYLRFNQFRIPRGNMLMRHAQVLPDGKYLHAADPRMQYSTMVYVRNVIVKVAGYQLAQAVTIATRYSVVRRQGLGPNALLSTEKPIYHYKSQHYRILTLISKAFAITLASRALQADTDDHFGRLASGDLTKSQNTHFICAGLKAWATQLGSEGAEDCRKLCGGQGYLAMSGLADIVASLLGSPTFEGENYVLWQQCFRFLVSCEKKVEAGVVIPEALSYLVDSHNKKDTQPQGEEELATVIESQYATADAEILKAAILPTCEAHGKDFLRPEAQLAIYQHRALRLLHSTSAHLKPVQNATSEVQADMWNRHMMSIIDAARANVEYLVVEKIHRQLRELPEEYAELRPVLTRLMDLFILSTIVNPYSTAGITWAEDKYLSLAQLDDIRALVDELLGELYYEAVGLTDGWGFTDASLCSAIGCYDGNVYERLMAWTRQLPINVEARKTDGVYKKGWEGFIKPFLENAQAKEKAKL